MELCVSLMTKPNWISHQIILKCVGQVQCSGYQSLYIIHCHHLASREDQGKAELQFLEDVILMFHVYFKVRVAEL